MSGVDDMNYMYSVSANNGVMRMGVNFDVKNGPKRGRGFFSSSGKSGGSRNCRRPEQFWDYFL